MTTAWYMGAPIRFEEKPTERPNIMAPALGTVAGARYKLNNDTVAVFSLDVGSSSDEDFTPDELNTRPGQDAQLPPLAWWSPSSGGCTPPSAVKVGVDLDGGPLYVGRATVAGDLLPGKVSRSHRVCYVAHEGREVAFGHYEVLTVERGRVVWVEERAGHFPASALYAGRAIRGTRPVFAVRALVQHIYTPGYLVSGEEACRVSFNGKEVQLEEYEVLTLLPTLPSRRRQRNTGRDQTSSEEDRDDSDDYDDDDDDDEEDARRSRLEGQRATPLLRDPFATRPPRYYFQEDEDDGY